MIQVILWMLRLLLAFCKFQPKRVNLTEMTPNNKSISYRRMLSNLPSLLKLCTKRISNLGRMWVFMTRETTTAIKHIIVLTMAPMRIQTVALIITTQRPSAIVSTTTKLMKTFMAAIIITISSKIWTTSKKALTDRRLFQVRNSSRLWITRTSSLAGARKTRSLLRSVTWRTSS